MLTAPSTNVAIDQTLTLSAQVKDASGAVLAGRTITFTSSDVAKATVSGAGIVTAMSPGAVTITATSGTATANLQLTITAGPPAVVAKISGDGQTATVGTTIASPLVIKVTDAKSNPVSGVAITWAIASGGGAFGTTTATTDVDGRAQALITVGAFAGANGVTASAAGISTAVAFTATGAWSTVRDDWTTYGHDGGRSSASLASVPGALRVAWRYVPAGVTGHAFSKTVNALATSGGVFLRSSFNSGFGYGSSPAVDLVTLTGTRTWTYYMGTDADFGDWGSLWNNRFIINDDGIRYLDIATGLSAVSLGADSWGETLSDATAGLFIVNDVQIDGPGVYVGALDAAGRLRWSANRFTSCRGSASIMAGGLALANSTIFFAPKYNAGLATTTLPFASGVFAFDAATGAQKASVAATPAGRMSADAQRVYLIENGNTLVARAQNDLRALWSKTVVSPGEQAPVLANGLVVIGTSAGVEAYDAASGTKRWTSAALSGADARWGSTYQGGTCGTVQIPEGSYSATTTIAAALGSNTLVVTTFDGIHVLSLATGADIWHAAIPQVSRPRNPIIVNDPTRGPIVYVVDGQALVALVP